MISASLIGRSVLDFALPPRCGHCGIIVDEPGSFCVLCWGQVDWLSDGVCDCCGIPLEGTDERICAGCLADPPKFERLRAATVYDDASRSLILRLKHGRQVGLIPTMARAIARQMRAYDASEQTLLVPVPLHRWRIWNRGFNQSGLLAQAISKRVGIDWSPDVLERSKSTKSLGGLSRSQRQKMVSGAFDADEYVVGRRIILVDDVFTTGSTIAACANALRKAGASGIDAIVWARVVRGRIVGQ